MNTIRKHAQWLALALLATAVILLGVQINVQPARALPEYASRTGESCATCHVNPGGGGPRTLRGLLWAAQGRPDEVPVLENLLIAPGVSDGLELYDAACAGCHGSAGEGLFGTALTSSGLTARKIRSAIERGRERSGMPGFEGQFAEQQLTDLVAYVEGLASGKIEPAPESYPLTPAAFSCGENPPGDACGGN